MSIPASQVPDSSRAPKRNWKAIAIVAVVLVAAGVAGFIWLGGDGDGRRDAALQACRAGKFAEAEPALKEALARKPDDVEVLDCLARGYAKAEQHAAAEPILSKLIELRPGNVDYLTLRLHTYQSLRAREKAYADAVRLLDLDPTDTQMRRTAMNLALEIARFAESEEHCRALLKEQPSDRNLRLRLSQIRQNRGDDAGAGQILDELIRENPNDYGALLARGILYDQTGHPDQAIPLLRRVFDEDRSRRRTSGYQLGMALDKVGQNAEAQRVMSEVYRLQDIELATEAIKSQPNNPGLMVQWAEKLIRDGHTADGIKLLESAVEQYHTYGPAHLALAAQYEKQGRADLAAKHRKLAGQSP